MASVKIGSRTITVGRGGVSVTKTPTSSNGSGTTFASATKPATFAGTNVSVSTPKPANTVQSVKPTSSGGSSRGGGSSVINNSSGRATGIDTGSQSVVLTDANKLLISGLNKGVPTPTGAEQANALLTANLKRGIYGDNLNSVNSYANQQKISEDLARQKFNLDQTKKTNFLNTKVNPLITSAYEQNIKNLQNQQQSVPAPTKAYLQYLRGNIGNKGNSQTGQIREQFTTNAKIDSDTANRALAKIKDEELTRFYLSARDTKINELQTRVNDGTLDVDTANKVYDSWFADFSKNELATKNAEATRELIQFNARYGSSRLNELAPKAGASFGTGVVVGGIFSGASLTNIGTNTLKTVGKGFSYLTPIVTFGSAVASQVTRGVREKELQTKYGFTYEEARSLAKREQLVGAVDFGVTFGAGYAGAIAGSSAVKAVANYSYLNKNEKVILDKILGRKDAFKSEVNKGYLTEAEVKNLALNQEKKLELINQIRGGQSIQKVTTTIDTSRLSATERAIANKMNYKIVSYQTVSQMGNKVEGLGVFRITAGRGLARLDSSMQKKAMSELRGYVKDNRLKGVLQTGTITEKSPRLLQIGKEYYISERRVDILAGTGKAKYHKSGNELIRVESVSGKSNLVRADVFDKNGVWIKSVIKEPSNLFKGGRVSKLTKGEFIAIVEGTESKLLQSLTFKDVKGTTFSGKERLLNLKVTKEPPSKKFRTLPENKPLIDIKPVSQTKTDILIKPVEKFLPEITPSKAKGGQTMAPSMVQMDSKAQSIYAGLGQKLSTQAYGFLLGTNLPKVTPRVVNTAITLKFGGLFVPTATKTIQREQTIFPTLSPALVPKAQELVMQKTLVLTKTKTRISSGLGITPKVELKPIEIQKPDVKPFIPIPLKPFNPKPYIAKEPYFTPVFGLPNLGEIQTGGGQRSRPTSAGLFGKTKYNASLGSVLLRTKAKKVTQEEYNLLGEQKFSGLGLRPQIEIVSKKKKKSGFRLF